MSHLSVATPPVQHHVQLPAKPRLLGVVGGLCLVLVVALALEGSAILCDSFAGLRATSQRVADAASRASHAMTKRRVVQATVPALAGGRGVSRAVASRLCVALRPSVVRAEPSPCECRVVHTMDLPPPAVV